MMAPESLFDPCNVAITRQSNIYEFPYTDCSFEATCSNATHPMWKYLSDELVMRPNDSLPPNPIITHEHTGDATNISAHTKLPTHPAEGNMDHDHTQNPNEIQLSDFSLNFPDHLMVLKNTQMMTCLTF
jgi:hypothetical protein